MHDIFNKHRIAWYAVAIILLFALALPFSSCTYQKPDTSSDITPGVKETTIFIASDLHLYSENLVSSDNKTYIKENFSSDGRVQEYDYELIRALVDEVNEKKPEFLVITGDLSYNGEEDSHAEVAKLLGGIEETKVLVIPGNHDLYSLTAFSAKDDKATYIDSIDQKKFREIYADFGYTGAYSYDEHSLSYIYELSEDKWALMLDTTLSEYNEENGFNIVGGFLDEPTMRWLEENLRYAKENGISVVSFSHHNLLVHNELFKSTCTLNNYEALLELYAKYNVSLNFSGHLHIQSIKSESVGESKIYDVSSSSLLDYGNRYGRLDIYDNCYSYESCLLDFADRDYSFRVFYREYYAKNVKKYQNALGEKMGEEAIHLIGEINAYYFDGSYEQIHDLIDDNKRLIRQIQKNTSNYESSYFKS
ncbi:MAG: metallophosphoesterase family protein, partial [Eubacteriales bacterium]